MTRRPLESLTHLQAFSTMLAHDDDAKALNTRDLQIIALLVAHNAPLTVGAISTLMSLSSQQVSRLTRKLCERGFLARREDKNDWRLVLYVPTKAGRALDERVRAHFETAGEKARQGEVVSAGRTSA
jgi:DNA-binding MarR family transcriptional regulator